MAFEVEFSITVAAPAEIVWKLLIDPSTWSRWWRDCLSARSEDLRALREGSKLELVLQPKHTRHTFRPIVDLITEERTLSLAERGILLRSGLVWYLQEDDRGVRVKLQGVFTGPASFFMRLFRADDSARFTLHASLRGLKKIAEQLS